MRSIVCSLVIVGSVSVLNASQESVAKVKVHTDFSGTWTIAPDRFPAYEGRANGPDGQLQVGVAPFKLVISQGADEFKIEEHRASPVQPKLNALEYRLNGKPTKCQFVAGAPRDAVPSEVKSKWEENKLVSTIDVVVPGEFDPRHYIEVLSISPDGILAVRIQRVGTADSRTLFYRKGQVSGHDSRAVSPNGVFAKVAIWLLVAGTLAGSLLKLHAPVAACECRLPVL